MDSVKIIKRSGIVVLIMSFLTGLALVLIIYVKQPHTPPIRDDDGEILSGGIASLEQVELGGIKQWILIRGQDKSKPLILFLHGGPGMPSMYLAHAFQRPLEEEFVVVQWDRRGAGKTFSDSLSSGDLSVSQLLSDTKELTELLRERFRKEKIFLVGHSFGSYLGMLFAHKYPNLIHAYIGVGQVVDGKASQKIQENFIRETARNRNVPEAIKDIENNGVDAYEKWLFEFGGELKHETSWWPLLWTGLKAPEYSLSDVFKVLKGSGFSSQYMNYDVIDGAIIDHVTEVEVPVYFFTGRFDYTTPSELVQQYHDRLKAPYKEIVWFGKSAHFPFFEEPHEFARKIKEVHNSGLHLDP